VPTAYDDLVKLLDDSSSQLQKSYSKLPHYLQKLVTSLPTKLTSTLAPELLATATEAQGLNASAATAAGASGGLKAAASKAGLVIPSLKELVTKPGAVIGMLKAIMNILKLRWPAFIGTNVLLSLGLFSGYPGFPYFTPFLNAPQWKSLTYLYQFYCLYFGTATSAARK
jgi:hypothetical protein